MSSLIALLILSATLVTAFLSGIFGMAGGLILMGVLVAVVPVAMAMIIHGSIQMVSNGWRAYLLRGDILWGLVGRYALGSVLGVGMLFLIAWQPDKRTLYLLLGLTPLLVWLPERLIDLDIQKPGQAVFAGFVVQTLNTLAGVAGPLLGMFFVRTDMTRQESVATRSITQVLAHFVKIIFWSVPVITAAGWSAMPPLWLIGAAIPLAMTGTWLGGRVLARMSDVNFRNWLKWLVTAIGLVMLARAAGWL